LIAARSINHAAQHALLKVLEEPPLTTKFYIILPTTAGLLPTVLSRVIIEQGADADDQAHPLFVTFLGATIPDRLALIADIVKRKADTDYDALYDGLVAHAVTVTGTDVLTAINGALRSLRQKGAARKMIWEHLALTFPIGAKR
jgi:DNA polymerase III delta prime subunit